MAAASKHSILGICFDLDDTLWPTQQVVSEAEDVLYQWIARCYPNVAGMYTMHTLRESRMKFTKCNPGLRHDLTKLRSTHLQLLVEGFGYDANRVAEGMELFLEYRNRVTPYPDVAPALTQLKSKYTLMSLTNGNASASGSPLGHFFAVSLSSSETGFAKPDHRIFSRLQRDCGIEAGRILHVGDNPHNDIVAASKAGMRTAWLRRDEKHWSIDPDADFKISDLHQLCDVLLSRPDPNH